MSRSYDLPLAEWIRIGLHADTLREAATRIRNDEPLEVVEMAATNRRYLSKILREETQKQFTRSDRPLLEVILNGIDAHKRGEAGHTIKTKVGTRSFACKDNGVGMTIEEIISYLSIPFNTEKEGVEEIGRFGVGFLSTLNYCLDDPKRSRVMVVTEKGGERASATFYSTGKEVENLRMRLSFREGAGSGTKVTIKRRQDKKAVLHYLSRQIHGIPSFTARLLLNGDPINMNPSTHWFSAPTTLTHKDKEYEQQVGVSIDLPRSTRKKKEFRPEYTHLTVSSQGVMVHLHELRGAAINVSFPPAVQLVEGRDTFKIDENYHRAAADVFVALGRLVEGLPALAEKGFVVPTAEQIAEMVPDIRAAVIKGTTPKSFHRFREQLLPGKEYVVTGDDFDDLLGDHFVRLRFRTGTAARLAWEGQYCSIARYLQDHAAIKTYTKEDLIKEAGDPAKKLIAFAIRQLNYHNATAITTISLLRSPTSGKRPLHLEHGALGGLYINLTHPVFAHGFSATTAYAVTTALQEEFDRRHEDPHYGKSDPREGSESGQWQNMERWNFRTEGL